MCGWTWIDVEVTWLRSMLTEETRVIRKLFAQVESHGKRSHPRPEGDDE